MLERMKKMRTKGACSFTTIKLGQLNSILKEDANIIVSRKFAESLGLQGEALSSKKVKDLNNSVANNKDNQVKFKVMSL